MRRLFCSLFILLALAGLAPGQVEIAKKDRVENIDPGYCAWCAIETLGRHHGVDKLVGLVQSRTKDSDQYVQDQWGRWVLYKKNAGYDWTIRDKLNKMGVKYKMSNTGSYDTEMVRYAMKNKLGCACAVRAGALGKGSSAHAVTVISYGDKKVEYIDPNDKSIYSCTRKWWDYWWDGWVLVVLPDERTERAVAKAESVEKKAAATTEAKVSQAPVSPQPPSVSPTPPAQPSVPLDKKEKVPIIQWKYVENK